MTVLDEQSAIFVSRFSPLILYRPIEPVPPRTNTMAEKYIPQQVHGGIIRATFKVVRSMFKNDQSLGEDLHRVFSLRRCECRFRALGAERICRGKINPSVITRTRKFKASPFTGKLQVLISVMTRNVKVMLNKAAFFSRLLGPRVCGRQGKNEKNTLSTRGGSFG